MPVIEVTNDIKSWADDLDVDTIQQAKNVAEFDFVPNHVALMADSHLGYGVPIGTVLPTKGAIIPSAIGVDIGCGMCAVETKFTSNDLPDDLHALHDAIRLAVPAGMGQGHDNPTGGSRRDRRWHKFTNKFDSPPMTLAQSNTAFKQFGSLGGGNHFVEYIAFYNTVYSPVFKAVHVGRRYADNGKTVNMPDLYRQEKYDLPEIVEVNTEGIEWRIEYTCWGQSDHQYGFTPAEWWTDNESVKADKAASVARYLSIIEAYPEEQQKTNQRVAEFQKEERRKTYEMLKKEFESGS